MSLSGDKGVAQFKKSVKMGHPNIQPKNQFKVQIIVILEEIDTFYWPKMHLWKGEKKFGQGPPPPHLDKIQKYSSFFLGKLSLTS